MKRIHFVRLVLQTPFPKDEESCSDNSEVLEELQSQEILPNSQEGNSKDPGNDKVKSENEDLPSVEICDCQISSKMQRLLR